MPFFTRKEDFLNGYSDPIRDFKRRALQSGICLGKLHFLQEEPALPQRRRMGFVVVVPAAARPVSFLNPSSLFVMLDMGVAEENIGTSIVSVGRPVLDQLDRGPDGPLIRQVATGDSDHVVRLFDFGFARFNQAQPGRRKRTRPIGVPPGGIPQAQAVRVGICRTAGRVVAVRIVVEIRVE